jgi:hypothetical protein
MVIDNSTFQHYSGTGITIQGGQSYWITNTSFSGCCGHASNIYYDIYLAGCKDILISGCHFDVEPFNSMNTPNAAVCVSSGVSNVIITANQFATSGYHTGALINNGTNVVNKCQPRCLDRAEHRYRGTSPGPSGSAPRCADRASVATGPPRWRGGSEVPRLHCSSTDKLMKFSSP